MKLPALHSQVFIFDLDDTLYKEIDYVVSAYRHIDMLLVADYDIPPTWAFNILVESYYNGTNPFDTLNKRLTEQGIIIPDAIQWMLSEYRYHVPSIHLDENTHFTLESLKGIGIPMYIITDGRSITQRNKIRSLELDKYIPWKNVFISEEQGFDKTDPHSFSCIKRRYESDSEEYEFVFIGDNPAKDFVVANQYGATSIQLADNGKNIHPQNIKVDKLHKAKKSIKQIHELNNYVNDWYF